MTGNIVRYGAVVALAALLAAGCGGDDDQPSTGTTASTVEDDDAVRAQVASFDLAVGTPQRLLVGLLRSQGRLVVGGEVELQIAYRAPGEGQPKPATAPAGITATGEFLPVIGTDPPDDAEPTENDRNQAGVYEARDLVFDAPGTWAVVASGTVDGEPFKTGATFEVLPEHEVLAPGDPAPRTENLLPGDPEAPPTAVDSRAEDDGTVPDPELHEITVGQAIANGKPTLLVVATPVYCVSRFCGPVTDGVQALAQQYDGRANFVHIEVWRNFEESTINRGAAEWIYPEGAEGAFEPWVFLVDGAGVISERWDNVANAEQIESALQTLIG